MMRLILGGLLIAHGIVHAALWLPQAVGAPLPEGAPFDTGRSWLVSSFSEQGARVAGGALAAAVAAAMAVAGVAYIADQGWWWWAAVAGAGGSLVLIALYWNVWLSLGVLIDVAILAWAMSVATTSGAEA
jgi:hypothetical protein